ncbi:MAG: cell wall hydrolase, partial [Sphingobium sp.]|nr:cell wall hydrolase [Sphingobium sp.]
EQAVAQVILNRVRHPAFPKSICGVVFEGAERTTGCQFTFTCDGALQRARFGAAAWARARLVARAALTGSVFAAVGHSTHYHTDWVVPYWSTSLDKVTAVGTHLFFRWSGWWGTPAAFTRQLNGNEPVIMQLAALSSAHRDPALGLDATEPAPATAAEAVRRRYPELAGTPDTFIVTLPANVSADELPALAALNCGERPYCKFLVWTDPAQAAKAFPLSPTEIATMAFSYLRDRATGYDKPLWNCAMFDRAQPQQCMRRQLIAADIARSPGPIVPRALPDPIAALERRQGTPMPLPRALPSPVPSPAIP